MLVSSDPEFPVKDKEGKYKSIIGKIGGSKVNPLPIKHGHIQEDGVLLECNPIPASTREEFIKNHCNILLEIENILKPLNLSIDISATALFDDEELDHPLAKLAGCEADFDAWLLGANIPPDLSSTNLRSAGGHLHVSFDNANSSAFKRIEVVRSFDIHGTLPSVILDKNSERRKLYGKAGCYRPKSTDAGDPYNGVELRSLSNFWLQSKSLMGWAYSAVETSLRNSDKIISLVEESPDIIGQVVSTINKSDAVEAKRLCDYLGVSYAT